ncbi:MAG TPA: VWA domain-containing protein [Thermoanaerobaculia bacterium]
MSFRSITMLWLLAGIPIVLLFLVSRERLRREIARRFVSERLRGISVPARLLRPWLVAGSLALALVAFAGPYAGFRLVPIIASETNRILVIDVSNSMAAADVGTSRLGAAKALATRLAEAQEGRVGLLVFEAGADVVSPLTTDTQAVVTLIQTLVPGELGQAGSDLGTAVIAALRLVEADPAQKVDIVLISDGEDQGARITEAVQRAKLRQVQVSTVMIGSADGSTIPTNRGPLRNDSGEIVTTYARSAALRQIAAETGGRFLENPFSAASLAPLEGARSATTRETHVRVPLDRYQWPLAAAFVLFLSGAFLNRGAE